MGQVSIKFEKGAPFLPLDQLLSVLPPASAHALPKAYAQLMLDENSRIINFYPSDFEVDTEGKHFMWRLTRGLKNELSENEAIRNSVKLDSLFVRSTSKLAEKMGSLSLVSKLETRISSDGIGGIISLCHESVEKPCSDICDKKEDCALCVYLELPAGSNHIPHLLSGVDLPEKTIFEGDIMETELWHERKRYYSSFDRVRSQDSWRSERMNNTSRFPSNASNQHSRSFSSNTPPSIYKGAGVGFSSGRGKRIDSMPNESMPLFLPSRKQHSHGGSYHATTNRDTRSQHFVDNFRQLRIPKSNNNHFPKPGVNPHFRPCNNGHMNQTETAPHPQGSQYNSDYMNGSKNGPNHQGSQYETVPFARGQDRDASRSSISLRPQWIAGKSQQVKDQNRW